MAPPRKLTPSVLVALGLGAACKPVADVKPCLDIPVDTDTDVRSDTDTDAGDTDTPPVEPCLEIAIQPCLKYSVCLSPIEPCLDMDVCLEAPPPETGPCLDVPADPDTEPTNDVCLSIIEPKKRRKGKKKKKNDDDSSLDVCLNYAFPDDGASPRRPDDQAAAKPKDVVRDAVLDRGVLPDDVAHLLRTRRDG